MGPPELPELMTASVWMKSSIAKPALPGNSGSLRRDSSISCSDRPTAQTIPAVTV